MLASFITRIESFFPIIEPLEDNLKVIILGYILDKITGKAKESIMKNGTIDTWGNLKQILIKNHGERTPIVDLIDELKLCRCDSTVENFYNKISSLVSRINNAKILLGEGSPQEIRETLRIALKHFTDCLPPLAKNLISCHNPDTLEAAYDLLTKAGYLSFTSGRNKSSSTSSDNHNNNRTYRASTYNPNRDTYQNSNVRNDRHNYQYSPNNFNNHNYNRNNYQAHNRHDTYNFNRQSGQRNNYANSWQTRRSNSYNHQRSTQRNQTVEPMDISINETEMLNNESHSNFQSPAENNYPI